tara:strand:+ start:83 stop:505 length:423 start_codon:yes stop_codon:yes gene_type:complete
MATIHSSLISGISVRFLSFLSALTLSIAACGTSESSCISIADKAIVLFQELITTVDALDLVEAAESGENFIIPGLDSIENRAALLQDESNREGCSDEELRELLTERIVRLDARTVFGQALIEGIRQEGLFGETTFSTGIP